jgi:hypothetical protein
MSQRRLRTPEDAWIKTKRLRVADQQGWLCHWCGLLMNQEPGDPMQVSLDEIVPRHAGGVARPGNYVAAHRKCNEERHPELNKRKQTEPLLVATTGETATSPFEILKGKIK